MPVAVRLLGEFRWDSDEELLTLTRADALRLITEYLRGGISADDCVTWAGAVEGRDDVGSEPEFESLLKDFLFEIATPEITRQLTVVSAEEWRARLTDSTSI